MMELHPLGPEILVAVVIAAALGVHVVLTLRERRRHRKAMVAAIVADDEAGFVEAHRRALGRHSTHRMRQDTWRYRRELRAEMAKARK